jgi:uncharacterized membrane protein YcfT
MTGTQNNWVNLTTGLCLVLFVISEAVGLHSRAMGIESWMSFTAQWVTPFALPTLFLIAGLFLPRTLYGSKSAFFDRKVLRFIYFYLAWMGLHALAAMAFTQDSGSASLVDRLASGLVQPSAGLWVLPLLALFALITWLVRLVAPGKVLAVAAGAQILHSAGLIQTGWIPLDAAAQYFIFFFAGCSGAATLRQYAERLSRGFADVPAALVIWAAINTVLVAQGTAALPVISLVMGFSGAFAMIALGVLLSRSGRGQLFQQAGRDHLAIYLAYLPVLLLGQTLLGLTGLSPEPGLAALALALLGLILPIGLSRLVRLTPLKLLYRRPKVFRLKGVAPGSGGQLIGASYDRAEEA